MTETATLGTLSAEEVSWVRDWVTDLVADLVCSRARLCCQGQQIGGHIWCSAAGGAAEEESSQAGGIDEATKCLPGRVAGDDCSCEWRSSEVTAATFLSQRDC